MYCGALENGAVCEVNCVGWYRGAVAEYGGGCAAYGAV